MFEDKDQNRNLLLAIALSLLVFVIWQSYFAPPPEPDAQIAPTTTEAGTTGVGPNTGTAIPGQPGVEPAVEASQILPREEVIERSRNRLSLDADRITGSINLSNGRIDDVTLHDYRETIDSDSPEIALLSPRGSPNAYFAEFSWVEGGKVLQDGGGTDWQTNAANLASGETAELTWSGPNGLEIRRSISVDENYMFIITDQVMNTGTTPRSLAPFGRIQRANTPEGKGFYILHVGSIGVLNGQIEDEDYENLREDGPYVYDDTTGWLGITDKYWLAALIPGENIGAFRGEFRHIPRENRDDYQANFLGQAIELQPGASTEATVRIFAGAKEVDVLTNYMERDGIDRFDMAIHFGWFFFLTKPLLSVLIYFANLLGNFGLSILLVTVIIKMVFFPLANKSYASMSKMKALQPKMTELREKYGEDKQKMQTELMQLYKREKVNPVSGCLPIALQIPVFFALYKVLFISIEMRHAPFYGWINDLSAPDPLIITTLFGLIPWDPPSFLAIGIWPLIMGVSMFVQQKLNPAPPDPVQAKVFMLMPIMFTFILAGFPAGLVIYWTWNNLLSMTQQYVIMRRMGVKVGGGKST